MVKVGEIRKRKRETRGGVRGGRERKRERGWERRKIRERKDRKKNREGRGRRWTRERTDRYTETPKELYVSSAMTHTHNIPITTHK